MCTTFLINEVDLPILDFERWSLSRDRYCAVAYVELVLCA